MADFRTKLITLAGIATMFSGMAYGQANCSTAAANAVFARAEGINEQVADVTLTCTVPAGNAAVTAGQTISITVYMSPSAAITSINVGTSAAPKSEAIAGTVTAGALDAAPGAANTPTVWGATSGSTVTFSNIALPAIAIGASKTIQITNIKINASTIATSSGVPTAVTETLFISGTGVVPNVLTSPAVGYVTNGLSGVKAAGAGGLPICNSTNTFTSAGAAFNTAFTVAFSEAFPNAFKIQGSAAANAALNSWVTNHSETGYGVTSAISNTATSGTRIQIVFNNIPSGYSIYVPISFTSAATNSAVLTLAPAGATAALGTPLVAGGTGTATANGEPGSTSGSTPGTGTTAALTVSNGSATAVYELTTVSTAPGTFVIPVYLKAAANAIAAPAGAITATVSFAPIGASSNVPNFVSGSSTATVNGSTFTACNTVLLFPFVTNQLGFDTGIAISNTSTDALTSTGGSVAAKQSGTCALTFFGASAPAAVTSPTVATGTAYAAAASTLAPGFQGYVIANCNFLYAHGFAYVVYNLTQNNGAAMGYLAQALTGDRKSTISTAIAGGAVTTSTVGSNLPE